MFFRVAQTAQVPKGEVERIIVIVVGAEPRLQHHRTCKIVLKGHVLVKIGHFKHKGLLPTANIWTLQQERPPDCLARKTGSAPFLGFTGLDNEVSTLKGTEQMSTKEFCFIKQNPRAQAIVADAHHAECARALGSVGVDDASSQVPPTLHPPPPVVSHFRGSGEIQGRLNNSS
ncbi:unnamed protein product [Pleuronectes platessa]|uniref:Uncharacterized protein n=1 Tax=Pleuronectes platessa TaxID=8262 RepID=A0A9N7UTE8_PLEPL|nr:unnamed protein product [Pleuronectes platessa]